jgi:hypothetical protein
VTEGGGKVNDRITGWEMLENAEKRWNAELKGKML